MAIIGVHVETVRCGVGSMTYSGLASAIPSAPGVLLRRASWSQRDALARPFAFLEE